MQPVFDYQSARAELFRRIGRNVVMRGIEGFVWHHLRAT